MLDVIEATPVDTSGSAAASSAPAQASQSAQVVSRLRAPWLRFGLRRQGTFSNTESRLIAEASSVQRFLADNRVFQATTQGILFRRSKSDADTEKVRDRLVKWDETVDGEDEGDGWLKVGALYLPMKLEGVQVLTPVSYFLADNRILGATTKGLFFRFSMSESDKVHDHLAKWGEAVQGVDAGDGWLKVGAFYLPMMLQGVRVLTPATVDPDGTLWECTPDAGNETQRSENPHSADVADSTEETPSGVVDGASSSVVCVAPLPSAAIPAVDLLGDLDFGAPVTQAGPSSFHVSEEPAEALERPRLLGAGRNKLLSSDLEKQVMSTEQPVPANVEQALA